MFKILVVDDEKLDREGILFLINKFNLQLEFTEASGGEEALRKLASEKFDIMLTDIKMPMMTGLELSRNALKILPDLEIIIFSSFADFNYAKKAMGLGITNYLVKPLKVQEFVSVLEDVINQCKIKQGIHWRNFLISILNNKSGKNLPDKINDTWPYGRTVFLMDFKDSLSENSVRTIENIINKNINSKNYFVYLSEFQILIFSFKKYENINSKFDLILSDLNNKNFREVFIVIGGEISDFNNISKTYEKMQELAESKFFTKNSMVLSIYNEIPKVNLNSQYSSVIKDEIIEFIKHGNISSATIQIDELFDFMNREGIMSALYTKYIAYEIVKTFYENFKDLNSEMFSEDMKLIFSAQDIYSLKDICIRILKKSIPNEDNLSDSGSRKVIEDTVEIIHKEYMNDINLEIVADRVLYTPNYLSHLFKKYTGYNFMRYLTDYRIKKAKELLKTSEFKVGTISKMVGYNHTSYFCTIFRNYTGLTPAQFREKKNV